MSRTCNLARHVAVLIALVTIAADSAEASLFTLSASGTITFNSSQDATVPVGTPWNFELTYNAAEPDLDFELLGAPDPTFGKYTNSAAPAALTFFHYQAGDYEATVNGPADFDAFSEVLITFTSVNAIDINIQSPASFPPLAGGAVSFHADFNSFRSTPVLASDALPTNTSLSVADFDGNAVTLLPAAGGVITSSNVTSLTLTAAAGTPGDFDGDGDVDGRDFLVWQRDPNAGNLADWQQNYGAPSLASAVAVPEPSSWLLAIGATVLFYRRPVVG